MSVRTVPYPTGFTPVTILRDFSTGAEKCWNTSSGAFEAFNSTHIGNYGIAATEIASPGIYVWTVPAAPASVSGSPYQATAYQTATGTIAESDFPNAVAIDTFAFDGTKCLDWVADSVSAAAYSIESVAASNSTSILSAINALPPGPNTVTVQWQTSSGSPVAGVRFSLSGSLGSGTANSSGGATFGMSNGSYEITSLATGGSLFATSSFTVSGATSLIITGTSPSYPTGNPPGTVQGLCMATDGQGGPQAGVIFSFKLLADSNGDGISGSTAAFASAPTNASGGVFVVFDAGWEYEFARGGTSHPNQGKFTAEQQNFVVPLLPG